MAKKNNRPIYVDPGLIESKAFNSLKRTKSAQILMHFLRRRKWSQVTIGKKKKWVLHNNGEIEFPYKEAKELGYSPKQFIDAKRELVEHGFVDIDNGNEGGIYDGDTANHSISERWRKFGTPEFIFKTIPKDTREGRGWKVYHTKQNIKGMKNIKRRKKKLKIKRRRKKRS